jgi:hypothetical protein
MRFRLHYRMHPLTAVLADRDKVERDSTLRLETTGLTLAEGKQILKHLQEVVVEEQVEARGLLIRRLPKTVRSLI